MYTNSQITEITPKVTREITEDQQMSEQMQIVPVTTKPIHHYDYSAEVDSYAMPQLSMMISTFGSPLAEP